MYVEYIHIRTYVLRTILSIPAFLCYQNAEKLLQIILSRVLVLLLINLTFNSLQLSESPS